MTETMMNKLNRIASTCEQAIYVAYTAPDDPEKGYPYATGYSREALKEVLEQVKSMLKENTNVG